MLVEFENKVAKLPTPEEQKASFVAQIKGKLKAHMTQRKQFIEELLNTVWDAGLHFVQHPNGMKQAVQVGLTPEQKIEALNEAGIGASLFDAATDDIQTLMTYSKGLEIKMPDNKANYDIAVTDGKVVITKK